MGYVVLCIKRVHHPIIPLIMPAPSTVKLLRSSDDTLIFAEATGNPSNPHVVLLAGLSLSGCVFDDFCSDQRLLDVLYIVCAHSCR